MFASMLGSTVNGASAGHGSDHGKESGSLLKKVVSNVDLSSVAVNGNGGGPPVKAPWDKKKLGLVGLRKWVRFDCSGETTVIQADKHVITQALGVQIRDLRLLDPQLSTSYPSAILCREQALVVNLEHIKCIIAVDHVLVLNADEENVIQFIEELQRRLTPVSDEKGGAGLTRSLSQTLPGEEPGDGDVGKAHETPFELRALEVALDVVCTYLERLTGDLEASAHPALDALTAQVSTHNLERVRRIKNRMVRLTTRVETIREFLEKLLDDDDDLHSMNLTARQQDILERQSSLARISIPGGGLDPPHTPYKDDVEDEEEIAEVEMVLETYFMHVDNTYNKLQTLCEYIDDTEDYINIELDNHRNQLIRLELLLTAATFAITIISVISGLFGMNLNNTHENSYRDFIIVSVVSSVGAIMVFVLIVLFCRYKKLLG